ncbi:MAG: hypothetical protein NVSMB52_16890 [Chloroflexota bacterium]
MIFDGPNTSSTGASQRSYATLAVRILALAVILGSSFAVDSPAKASTSGRLEGVPRLSQVFTVVLENESYSATWGPGSPATYLNSLRSRGVLLTNYYGAGHVSADNYISMTSGQAPNPDTSSDCQNWLSCKEVSSSPLNGGGISIADQLEANSRTWKAYMGDMPAPCTHATAADAVDPYGGNSTKGPGYNYADRHNPFIYYAPIVDNPTRCAAHITPLSQLTKDFAHRTVPNYAFIVPGTCDDGHDVPTCADGRTGGLVAADSWLRKNVPPILNYVMHHNGMLVITFDEAANSDTSGCCGAGPGGQQGFGGRVGLLAISPHIIANALLVSPYDHASLLRTTEDAFGIATHLNNAGSPNEHAMSDLFRR